MIGFLNIYKPSGMTSHKIISILRKITGIKKIGHAGTLDPLACGVLPIAIGKAVKLIDYLKQNKRYIVGMEFGKRSDTFDIDGNIEIVNSHSVEVEQIENVLKQFIGDIKQIPPAFSAVHYKGKRLYELARNGNIPNDIPSREVSVKKIEIMEYLPQEQKLKLDIECSKGTYIRSIVNDMGELLGTGAIMYELQRQCSGGMNIEDSLIIDENTTKQKIEENLINPISLLDFDCLEVNDEEYDKILNGNKIMQRVFSAKKQVILSYKGNIAALAEIDGKFTKPKKLLI